MFNAQHVRSLRDTKNKAARAKSFSGGGNNLPFIEPAQLNNGEYHYRLWSSDSIKNPFGYLYYRLHTLLDAQGRPVKCQCPRSTNWEPMPAYHNVMNSAGEHVDRVDSPPPPDKDDPYTYEPFYTTRCWCCETETQGVELGFENLDQYPESLGEYMKKLFGDEKWHFPATIKAEVASAEPRWDRNDPTKPVIDKFSGKQIIDYTYRSTDAQGKPTQNLIHCDLSMGNLSMKDTLLDLIEEVPDCSHMLMGRWFRLKKKNDGKGSGGYEVSIAPTISAAGFELPEKGYPNYTKWGVGNPSKGDPGSRKTYAVVEALGSDPVSPYAIALRDLGFVLADNEEQVPWA